MVYTFRPLGDFVNWRCRALRGSVLVAEPASRVARPLITTLGVSRSGARDLLSLPSAVSLGVVVIAPRLSAAASRVAVPAF